MRALARAHYRYRCSAHLYELAWSPQSVVRERYRSMRLCDATRRFLFWRKDSVLSVRF